MIDHTIAAENVSVAWLLAVDHVRGLPKRSAMHLVVRVADPSIELPEIRHLADGLLARAGAQPIDTVRNTIFPAAYAERFVQPRELAAYYRDQYPTIKRVSKKNRGGTYFGRLVAYPFGAEQVDQLSSLVDKLRTQREKG